MNLYYIYYIQVYIGLLLGEALKQAERWSTLVFMHNTIYGMRA